MSVLRKSLLRDIDSSKATGSDTVPPKLAKAVANELAQPISSLVNMSLSLSCFPRELVKSETYPLDTEVRTISKFRIIDH